MTESISSNNPMPATQSAVRNEGPQPKKAKGQAQDKTEDGADFAVQLSQLGAAAQAAPAQPIPSQSMAPASAEPSKLMKAEKAEPGLAQAMPQVRAPKASNISQGMAEKAPVSQMPAASLNTATAIAGLKPWSKDWVFVGNEQENPDLKGLLDKGQKADPTQLQGLAALKAAIQEARAQAGATEGAHGKVTQAESRGDAGAAIETRKNGLTDEQAFALDPSAEIAVAGMRSQEHGAAGPMDRAAARPNLRLSGDEFLQTMNAAKPTGVNAHGGQKLDGGGAEGEQGGFAAAKRPDLKLIQGGAKKPVLDGGPRASFEQSMVAGTQTLMGRHPAAAVVPAEISGHVVKGAMAKDRLSSEALLGVSTGIKNLTPMGGGEIRVRLKPDNLGEVQIRVVAHGNDVGVHFRASDERARQIIEESMSHLKESLASQNLNVGRIDVSVAHPSMMGENRNDSSQQQQQSNMPYYDYASGQSQHNSSHWQQGQGGSAWDRLDTNEAATRGGSYLKPGASALSEVNGPVSGRSMDLDGRLDVMA